jgi:phthiocerol/phenolphthiocerol synthesis type-I polyketide synthase C
VRPQVGGIGLMSTVRGALLSGPEMDVDYWVENLRRPVLFADAMGSLLDAGVTHVVEISPHPVLAPAIEQLAEDRAEPARVLTSLRRGHGTPADLVLSLARGYVSGLEPFGTLPRADFAALPDYPWQRTSYWTAPGRRRGAEQGGLEPVLAPSASESDAWQGTLDLDLDDQPWLRDHKVHEAVVLPGAAMVALALSTARARTGALPAVVDGFAFRDNLTLGEEPVRVSALWRDDVAEGGSFTLLSLAPGGTGWTRHATGRLSRKLPADATGPTAFPGRLLDGTPLAAADFYRACADRGLDYGPAFQGVTELWTEGEAALASLSLPARCRPGARPHGLHPALWDAALQASLALVGGDETVVPTAVERVLIHQEIAEPVVEAWSYALRRDATHFDIRVYDADRQPLLTLEGLTLEALEAARTEDFDADRVHRLRFRELARPESADGPAAGPWAICQTSGSETDESFGRRLAEALTANGADAVQLLLDGTDGADALLWGERLRERSAPGELVFVAPSAAAGLQAQRDGLLTLTALVRAALALPVTPRLTVLTTGAQGATAEDRPDPGAALYWGFGRVVRREHSELRPLLLDLDALADDADLDAVAAEAAAELLGNDQEDQLALRAGRRLVGRLVRGAGSTEEEVYPWHSRLQPFRLSPTRPGYWDGLEFRPLNRQAPGEGEVEIAVTAAALNFIDVMKAMGTYPDTSAGATSLGGECTGLVVAVGPGVTGTSVGDRVVACAFGAIASHVTVRAAHTRPVPHGMSDQDAAALPLVLTTAWYGLVDLAGLEAGETVLVHSATGGLGLAAIRVARARGAVVIATAGSAEKRAYLRGLGIEHVFDSRDLSWAEQVRTATGGRGVDVVLNSLTGAAIPLGLGVLAEDGRFIEVGKKDIYAERSISLSDFRKSITLASVDLAGLMDRRPERYARLFARVWDQVASGALEPLPVLTHTFAEAAEALRAMSHGDHIGKFVLIGPNTVSGIRPEPMPGGRFRADSSYLVTGGLGALGLSLAEHLAANGAGALALLGRSAPTPEALARIEELRAGGVLVRTVAVDVADGDALGRALDTLRAELPPLRGVFHAAGLLDDATVVNLKAEQVERVISPKIDGARNLDRLTADDTLDLFVVFSSAAALFGNAGQAAYAAGNAFMDSLAEARRRRGLPGLSVQWGPFEGIGLAAADANRGARLAERGMGGFTADEAWAALSRFLGDDERVVVGYVPLNLRQWFDAYPDTAGLHSWQVLRQASEQGDGSGSAGGEFLSSLLDSPALAWPVPVEAKVRELAGRVLRLDTGAIDRETPFKALGLDSLMSLELRNRLESTFGLKLSPTLLWTYGNTKALSGVLCERLAEARPAAA